MRPPLFPRLASAAYGLCLAVIGADQASKYWILNVLHLQEDAPHPVIGGFRLSMVWNPGVSFGFFRDHADWARWGFCAFSLIVAAGLAVWARRVERPILAGAIGLIMGGAVGNVVDRVRFGRVADFLDFSPIHVFGLNFPWVFNVADSAICIGVGLLLLDGLLAPRKSVAA